MATASKKISQLPPYIGNAFNTGVIPANFGTFDNPDTFKIALSTVFLNLPYAEIKNDLTVDGTLYAETPVIFGDATYVSEILILRGSATGTTLTTLLTKDGADMTLNLGDSWNYKIHLIGRSSASSRDTAFFEFSGSVKRRSTSGSITELVGTPTKIIHARDNTSVDANVVVDSPNFFRIKVNGATGETYFWTAQANLIKS
jgi:hypothetical protein